MDLLRVHTDPAFMLQLPHPKNPSIRIATVNPELLPHFAQADLSYFGMIDGRDTFEHAMASPAFFKDKKKGNSVKQALHTSLSGAGEECRRAPVHAVCYRPTEAVADHRLPL
jgi:hypothetical protein